MAKCNLSIDLEDPDLVYAGGGTITGTVRVDVDSDVNCKGLEVSSNWRTHGRGNVASGTTSTEVLYSGPWTAGEQNAYRFELPIANWPPSYHGHYLNVDHYVDARAKIPWGFDPKASVPFKMRPTSGSDLSLGHGKSNPRNQFGIAIAAAISTGFLVFFVVAVSQMGLFGLVFMTIPLLIGMFLFVRTVLPKYLLGEIEYRLSADEISPGDRVDGELAVRPRRNVSINGVTLTFQAREQCVSGSGSNRTTHKHVLFEKQETLQSATTLSAGTEHRFPFSIELPDDAPFSIDLDDNDLIWSTNLRVDIPRWPDWTKELPLRVVPSTELASHPGDLLPASSPPASSQETSTESSGEAADGITFAEAANYLWAQRNDRGQLDTLVEAVTGLTFQLEASVERRLLYSGDEDPHVYKDGYAIWAHYPEPELPMVLYVPHELADEFEQIGSSLWRGRGTIVGWDTLHGRLQVKLERPTAMSA